MNNLYLLFFEIIYIVYMLCFFKTRYSIAHPMSKFNNDLFNHPIGIKKYPKSMICKFGKIMSILISIFLLLRYFFNKNINLKNKYMKIHFYLLFFFSTLCLINFNALLYLFPIFILELYFINYI